MSKIKSGMNKLHLLEKENLQLREWKRQLSSIVQFGHKIATVVEVDNLLQLIADETKQLLKAERCTLFLLDKEKDELWSKIAHGMEKEEIRFPSDKGLAGYVITTGETTNIKDAYADPRFNPEVDKKTGYRTKSILCQPLKNQLGEIIGVFQVLNKKKGYFTQRDQDLLQIFSAQAASAIENVQLYADLKKSFDSFVRTLAATIDARDPLTAGHSQRVTEYSLAIAKQLHIKGKELELLKYASILHDLGKIGVREAVLTKPGRLDEEEYKHIQTHASLTRKILERTYFQSQLEEIPQVAGSHHEKINGGGYPQHLQGKNIPRLSRIMAIADVFDAITNKRHYRDPMPIKQALSIITGDAGSHFDPECVEAFMKVLLNKLVKILKSDREVCFAKEDLKLLSRYNTGQLFSMLEKDDSEVSVTQKKVIDKFNYYYNLKGASASKSTFL